MLFAVLGIIVVFYLCIEFEFIRKLVAKLFFGTLAVALLIYGACAVQNAARAEELPDGFYYKVVFIDEVEDQGKELHIHTDDLNHLWNYWEDSKEIDFNNNEALEELAKYFIEENDLWSEEETETIITRGRIVVLTMWEATEDPWDDEVVDMYYSELITR